MIEDNPFFYDAAEGATAEEMRKMEWERQAKLWQAHVEGCRSIMRVGILPRMELAAEAARAWGHEVVVEGIRQTETHTGVVHLRAEMRMIFGVNRGSKLEFIGSPKSLVIAAEGSRLYENKKWGKVSFTAEAIRLRVDEVIKEFLKWGVISK